MSLPYAQPEPFTSRRNPKTRALLGAARQIWLMFTLLLMIGAIVWASNLIGGPASITYLGFFFVIFLFVVVHARTQLHRRRVAAVFDTVSRGIRVRLPLPEFVEAAAWSERGILRKRLLAVSRHLFAGLPVERAIGESLPEIDQRQAGLLLASAATGSTADTLERLASEHATQSTDPLHNYSTLLGYALWSIGLQATVLAMILVFVIPKMETIFQDFGAPPIAVDLKAMGLFYTIAGAIAAGLLACLIIQKLAQLYRIRGTAGISDPIFSRARRNRALSDFYHTAADTLQAGLPLAELLPRLQDSTRTAKLGNNVGVLLSGINDGVHLTAAARNAGLPKRDVAILALAHGQTQLVAAFRYLAEVRERAFLASRDARLAITSLLLTLFIAAMTLPVVYLIWVPMLQIMDMAINNWSKAHY